MKIFYDGDCIFCKNYVRLLQLKEIVGDVELISLRSSRPEVRHILNLGLNVNTGFVVVHNGITLHGSEAFEYINDLVEPNNIYNRTLKAISGHEKLTKLLYPLMVLGRLLLLAIQGGALIDVKNQSREECTKTTLLTRTIRLVPAFLGILAAIRLLLFYYSNQMYELGIGVYIILCFSIITWALFYINDCYGKIVSKKLLCLDVNTIFIYATFWLATVNLFDLVSFRRIAGFLCLLPVVVLAIDIGSRYQSDQRIGFVPAWTPFAIIFFAFFPGLYFAPFYGGIAGWTIDIDLSAPVIVSGYKLVNNRSDMVWHNHAFFQPVSMDGRLKKAFSSADPSNAMFAKFLVQNYKNIYPELERGNMPHEWLLGKFAYKTHNLSKSNASDYVEYFHPNNIVGVQYVNEYYSRDGNLIDIVYGDYYPVSNNDN